MNVDFRNIIYEKLLERNRKESLVSIDVLDDYSYAVNRLKVVMRQVEELRYENDKLKSVGGGSGSSESEEVMKLTRKMYTMQDELTNSVKEKAALNIQSLELKLLNNEKDKTISELHAQIKSLRDQIHKLEELNREYGESIKKSEDIKRTLTDEISANLLAYRSLDTKCRGLEDSNNTLKESIRSLQSQLEAKRIEEYDKKYRANQDAIKKSLMDAANSSVDLNMMSGNLSASGVSCVPSRVIQRLEGVHEGEIGALRFSPCGQVLATSGSDRTIKIWTYGSGGGLGSGGGTYEYKATLTGCNGSVIALDFEAGLGSSVTSKSLLLGCSTLDSSCRIWSLADYRMQLSLTGHTNKVVAGRFLYDSSDQKVVTGSTDRTLKLWDCRTRGCIKTMLAMSACHDLVVSPTLGMIASGHFDKKLRLWDARGGDLATDQLVLSGRITGLDIHNTCVLAATKDDCLQTIDLRMLQLLQTYTAPHFKPGSDLVRPCYSPCGQYIVCGSHDGSVFVWNTRSGKLEKTISKEHNSLIVAVHWNPAINIMASCERNRKIVIYGE